jgi:ribosome assembly protein 1
MANPMLKFDHWRMIDIDPFYMPVNQEVSFCIKFKDIDNLGSLADTPNLAKTYINKIRVRKGLPVDEKLVKHADKQSNLSKKK